MSHDWKVSRRQMLAGSAVLLAASKSSPANAAPAGAPPPSARASRVPPGQAGRDYTPVIVPNGATLPWKLVDGVKVFHLVAEEVEHEFAPGLKARCWGYNGRVHGPTIEAVEGDRVRIYVTNRLPAPTTVHWHGVLLPERHGRRRRPDPARDPPGETFKYEFTLRQHGTFMYHSHHDEMTQMALGHDGHVRHPPARPRAGRRVDRDFAIMLHEWRIDARHEAAGPERDDRLQHAHHERARRSRAPRRWSSKKGERVRIRLGNLSAMDHHPIHLHGYQFKVTETDGGADPAVGAVARDHGARRRRQHARRSSSSPTSPATGRCTAT